METKDVTVISFQFEQDYKKPTVKAMVRLKLAGAPKDQFTRVDLSSKESEAIIEIARSVEYRLQTGGALSSEKELRRSRELESLYAQLSKRYNNLFTLQEQAANYGAGEIPIALQNKMVNEEQAITDLEDRLHALRSTD